MTIEEKYKTLLKCVLEIHDSYRPQEAYSGMMEGALEEIGISLPEESWYNRKDGWIEDIINKEFNSEKEKK